MTMYETETHKFVKVLGASLVLLLLVATCGRPAYASDNCKALYDPYIAALLFQMPGSYIVETLTGDVLKRWLSVYNDARPKTNEQPDKVVTVAAEVVLGQTVVTLFVTDGCITEARRFLTEAYNEMKAGLGQAT